LSVFERAYGSEHYDIAVNLNNLAAVYQATGRGEQAEPFYLRALRMKENLLGPDHPDVAMTMNNLAVFYKSQRRFPEAAGLYLRALAIFERTLEPGHPKLVTCRDNYEELLREMNHAAARNLLSGQGRTADQNGARYGRVRLTSQ
jgi:tetratricopeptide (TPR) repeat protein